jgi:hypothetical protein
MLQILISLGILLLWALTSLLSRETQPLPPRPLRPRPGDGSRPSPIRFPESDPRSARSLAGTGATLAPPPAPSRGTRSPARRGLRGRSNSGPAVTKTVEPEKGRRLTSQINLSMANAANRPLEITPLEIPLSSLSSTLTPLGSRASIEPRSSRAPAPTLNATSARAMLSSPEKLREVAILTEILKPPLALRQSRRSRRRGHLS